MKKVLILFCFLIISGCMNVKKIEISQTNFRDEQKEQLEIVTEFVRIREKPDINSDVLGQVHKGEIYTILSSMKSGVSSVWYEIETSTGIRGYIISEFDSEPFIKLLQSETILVQTNQKDDTKNQLEIITDFIRIRKEPNTLSDIIGQVYKGEIYTILSSLKPNSWDNMIWYEIETLTGIRGYIINGYNSDEYVKLIVKKTENKSKNNTKNAKSNDKASKNKENSVINEVSENEDSVIDKVSEKEEDDNNISEKNQTIVNEPIVNNISIVPHVNTIRLNKKRLDIRKGENYVLEAIIEPENAINKTVKWTSSDRNIVLVDSFGKVTAVGVGSAIVTAITEDGNYTDTCEINVTMKPLTVSASIGIAFKCQTSGCGNYMYVGINATGGSEKYQYSYKLYKDGMLIGNYTEKETYFRYIKGNYRVEYVVTDSDGVTESGQIVQSLN